MLQDSLDMNARNYSQKNLEHARQGTRSAGYASIKDVSAYFSCPACMHDDTIFKYYQRFCLSCCSMQFLLPQSHHGKGSRNWNSLNLPFGISTVQVCDVQIISRHFVLPCWSEAFFFFFFQSVKLDCLLFSLKSTKNKCFEKNIRYHNSQLLGPVHQLSESWAAQRYFVIHT